ncbi:MAG: YiiD C-terminal domain-containing protein [Wenzhouxiangella sp.]|jgi:thioesterase domain-containing protein|nr:YiiD C-terminal domain-containing protein [Wenzhouxiangella sp.]
MTKKAPGDAPADERVWLEDVLRSRIPLAETMKLSIAALDADGIRLDFPLAPSINDKGSAFGGALASAMILAGWSLPRLLLRRKEISADLVIGRCELKFMKPVYGAYSATCRWPDASDIQAFIQGIAQQGKGRLDQSVTIVADGEVAASLQARYAALTTQNAKEAS